MESVFLLLTSIILATAQIPPGEIKDADVERHYNGYYFHHHADTGHYLVRQGLNCYVVDAPEGSDVEKKLHNTNDLRAIEKKVISIIEQDKDTMEQVPIQTILDKYQDSLTRAFCFRATVRLMELEGRI